MALQGQQIQIYPMGITRNTPAQTAKDGEMDELINLRYKDGALRPTPSRKVVLSGVNYSPVYVHAGPGYKHYLGVSDGKLYYFADDVAGVPTLKETPVELTSVGTITVSNVGNVVTLLSDTGIKHLIWYDSAYRVLDVNFDGQSEQATVGPVRVELKTDYKGTPSTNTREMRMFYSDEFTTGADKWEAIRDGYVLPTILKALAINKQDGYLQGFHLAITAVELFDGSYILHSNPVLIGQPNDKGTRYSNLHGASYDSKLFLGWDFSTSESSILFDTSGDHNAENKYYKQSKSSAYPHPWGEDAETANVDFPGITAYVPYYFPYNSSSYRAIVYSALGELKYKVSLALDNTYEPLIKSVGVFLTPEVNQYRYATLDELGYGEYLAASLATRQFRGILKTNAEITKELFELPFYKVAEVPFSSLTATTDWVTLDLKGKLGDSLVTNELLPVDPMSYHTLSARYQFMYNSRLHLLDYSQSLSHGYPLQYFYQLYGAGQFIESGEGEPVVNEHITYALVDIMTDSGLSRSVRTLTDQTSGVLKISNMGSVIAYPDNRARKITLFRGYNNGVNDLTQKLEFDLTPHPVHNFAYYVSPDLKPIRFVDLAIGTLETIPDELNREQRYQNGLKVSQVYNPFTFPLETVYRVGSGRGIALASNSIPLSSGQFGEYPLIVFCTDGIHAMFVAGGEITYSSSRPLARDVCSDAKSVKTIDGGTVFISDRGLMMLSGDKVIELSETIEGAINPYITSSANGYLSLFHKAINNASLVQMTSHVSTSDFSTYLEGAIIGYNHKDRELWVTNPAAAHSFIYSQNRWSKITTIGTQFVNDYPNDFLLSDGKLLSLHESLSSDTPVAFLTRPVKMGTLKFKQSARAILRAALTTNGTGGKYAGLYVFGSYDGEKWAFIGGTEQKGTLRDIGVKIELSDMVYFRFGLVGQVSPASLINFIDATVEPKMTGKLR